MQTECNHSLHMGSRRVIDGLGLGPGRRIKTLWLRSRKTKFTQGIYLKNMQRDGPIQRGAQDNEPPIGRDPGYATRLLCGNECKRIIWSKPSSLSLDKSSDDMRCMISILLLGERIYL